MNVSNLRPVAEMYKVSNNSSYQSLCKNEVLLEFENNIHNYLISNDRKCYGPVLDAFVPVKDISDNFTCNTDAEDYAIEAYLSDRKEYVCIDAGGEIVHNPNSVGLATQCSDN